MSGDIHHRSGWRHSHRSVALIIREFAILLSFGHDGEPARARLELPTAALLMRRRPDQSRQCSLHPIPLHSADPHQRVLHGGPPHVQPGGGAPIIRRRLGFTARFVQAAPERTGVSRRRAHARLPRTGGRFLHSGGHGDGPVRRTGPVEREAERPGCAVVEVYAGWGGGALQWARCGEGGGSGRGEGGGVEGRLRVGGVVAGGRGGGPDDRSAWSAGCVSRHWWSVGNIWCVLILVSESWKWETQT